MKMLILNFRVFFTIKLQQVQLCELKILCFCVNLKMGRRHHLICFFYLAYNFVFMNRFMFWFG